MIKKKKFCVKKMKASLNTSQGVYIEFDDRKNYTTKNIYKYDMSFVNRYK